MEALQLLSKGIGLSIYKILSFTNNKVFFQYKYSKELDKPKPRF